jgi:hypothetical protein
MSDNEYEKPLKKTLTQLLQEVGMQDLPKDNPLYKSKFVIYLRAPSKRPAPSKSESSETSGLPDQPQNKLIDRNSRDPDQRQRWIRWLAALSVAFRAPQAILLPRVREVLWSARKDGVDWKELYEVAKDIQPDRYPQPPELGLVAPKR